MALTDGYLTLPKAAEYVSEAGYPIGAATLRKGCLAFTRHEKGALACEVAGSGRALTYYVKPEDALTFAKAKYAPRQGRGRGRPAGTLGIKHAKKLGNTNEITAEETTKE